MSYQSITIVGNVGREPELRYTPAGIAVTDFSVGVNKVTGKGDDRKESTTWFKCTAWRDQAETVARHVHKGQLILVVGEVSGQAWTNKEGNPQVTLIIMVGRFQFLGKKADSESGADRGKAKGKLQQESEEVAEEASDIPF
jgi:single-strand DNA-binding protein